MAGGAGGSAGTETLLGGTGEGQGREGTPVRVTCPGPLSLVASTHLSRAGRRARRATASWYKGGWGGKGSPAAPQNGGCRSSRVPPTLSGCPPWQPGPFFHFPFPGPGSAAAALGPPPRPGCPRPPQLPAGPRRISGCSSHLHPAGQAEVPGGRWRCHRGPGGGSQVCGARRGSRGVFRAQAPPLGWSPAPGLGTRWGRKDPLGHFGGAPVGAWGSMEGLFRGSAGLFGVPIAPAVCLGVSRDPAEPLRSRCRDFGCPYRPYMGPLKLFWGCL